MISIESVSSGYERLPPARADGRIDEASFEGRLARRAVLGIRGLSRVHTATVEHARKVRVPTRGMAAVAVPSEWVEADEYPVIPDLWLLRDARVFGGAIVGRDRDHHWDGQLVTTEDGKLIPASFGCMDGNQTLARGIVRYDAQDNYELVPPGVPPRYLDGAHVLLGNMHRHWGHAILEGLTRAWVKPLLDMPVKWLVYEGELPAWGLELLQLAGISDRDLVHASPYDVVERLIVPDVGMRTHRWITSAQADAWDLVRQSAAPSRRVYLSRSRVAARKCMDEAKVEEIFRAAGWEVIRPEELGVRDQVRLAAECSRLAGLVGSQMYLAAFQQDRGRNVVIAPENFFLRDDLLIAAARSHEVEVILGGPATASEPARTWRLDAAALERIHEAARA